MTVNAEEPEFYTIQTGSFKELASAEKQFDKVVLGLIGINGQGLDYLRIEKIGTFYAVRVGKFTGYSRAEEYLQGSRSRLGGAIILRAAIREERVIKRYGNGIHSESRKMPQGSGGSQLPDISAPVQEPDVSAGVEASLQEEAIQQQEESAPEQKQDFLSTIKGRFTISDYYSTDSGDFDLHVASARINLYRREESTPGFYFEVDGKVRKKIVEGDLRGYVPRYKVDEAWLGYVFPGQRFRVLGGRQYIQELYNTDIDGLNAKYSFHNGLGLGIFGGFAPDKFDDSFNEDYKTIGAYGFMNLDDHKASLGYEYLTYGGEPDREYFSVRAYSKLNKKLRLNGLTSINKNQLTDNYEVETANGNIVYSYTRNLRFNVFGNYYRTIKYYESSKFFLEFSDTDENFTLDTNSRTRAGLRVDYKIAKGLKVYGSAAYQHRKADNEDSTRLTGGIRKYGWYGFDLSGRYTYIDNYASRDDEYKVEVNRNIMNKFDISVYASYEESKLDLENAYTSGARTYGSSLYWPITKQIYLTMFGEYLDEDDYRSTSIFGQLGYKL